jgi:hypothetical protein
MDAVRCDCVGFRTAGLDPIQSRKDISGGAADIGKGPVKGAGSAAKGVAKGTGDLVTLHPVSAVGAVGKDAAGAGKDVTVGAVKGTGKIVKGVGKTFGKIF